MKIKKHTHNIKIYGSLVKTVTNNEHDLIWLCNKFAKAYRSVNDLCIDNFRISRSINGQYSNDYKKSINSGCCGFYDKELYNNLTKNYFWIGFNYGH